MRNPLVKKFKVQSSKFEEIDFVPLRAFVPSCLRASPSSHFEPRTSRSGFSLIEMMIAIVILGLGLVMVATMFPVAWDRARTLSEHTTEQTIASAAHARMEATLRPAGIKMIPNPSLVQPPYEIATIAPTSFAGDLLFDQALARSRLSNSYAAAEGFRGIIPSYCDGPVMFYSDTRVHALNTASPTCQQP